MEGCQDREATIRCTLVTNSSKPVPHVHRLGGEGNSNGNTNEGEYQEIIVSANKNEWIATCVYSVQMLVIIVIKNVYLFLSFSGLTIIHTAKKQVREVVERRLVNELGNAPINRNQGQQV